MPYHTISSLVIICESRRHEYEQSMVDRQR